MGVAYFYHLTHRPLEDTLRMLLGKAQQAGWRTVVRGGDAARIAQLDAQLWLGPEDSFLPHGIAGGAHDADQPILLTAEAATPAGAECLMTIDGASIDADEVTALQRVCVLFDGNNDAALGQARTQWKALKDAGVSAQYWSEDSGKWEKKAET
ncbi:MAG: DNA polymerase III subunit chi [Sulfitobacter sp.]